MGVTAAISFVSASLQENYLLMKVVTGTLVNVNIIDPVHNLWELTLMIDDDSLSVKKYEVQSKYPFRNDEIRRFKLTLKGDEVVKIEPLGLI